MLGKYLIAKTLKRSDLLNSFVKLKKNYQIFFVINSLLNEPTHKIKNFFRAQLNQNICIKNLIVKKRTTRKKNNFFNWTHFFKMKFLQ